MFSYYGSKSKLVNLYPAPKYPKIIEPFAGSARYALKWWDRDVLLVDKYEVIVKVWHYLQQASPGDILGLPEPKFKEKIPDSLSEGEKLLLGFLVAGGSYSPRNQAGSFTNYKEDKKRIINDLPKIKHWVIKSGSFNEISNQEAVWFIDPPYYRGGHKYIIGNDEINYSELAKWSQSRQGQVMVCENTKADWLPFWAIGDCHGAQAKTTEAIWCNDVFQPKLF